MLEDIAPTNKELSMGDDTIATPLILAASNGLEQSVRWLLDRHDINVNLPLRRRKSPRFPI